MDEAEDRIRAVRTKQYKYIHNYFPEIPYAQYLNYMDEMPTMKVWRQWHREDKLSGPQKLFFAPRKPAEELYDTVADPYEINDLAESPKHQEALKELRAALDRWIAETHDLGEVPERQLIAQGLVADKLQTEYAARKKLHPPEPPVKGAAPESEWRIGK